MSNFKEIGPINSNNSDLWRAVRPRYVELHEKIKKFIIKYDDILKNLNNIQIKDLVITNYIDPLNNIIQFLNEYLFKKIPILKINNIDEIYDLKLTIDDFIPIRTKYSEDLKLLDAGQKSDQGLGPLIRKYNKNVFKMYELFNTTIKFLLMSIKLKQNFDKEKAAKDAAISAATSQKEASDRSLAAERSAKADLQLRVSTLEAAAASTTGDSTRQLAAAISEKTAAEQAAAASAAEKEKFQHELAELKGKFAADIAAEKSKFAAAQKALLDEKVVLQQKVSSLETGASKKGETDKQLSAALAAAKDQLAAEKAAKDDAIASERNIREKLLVADRVTSETKAAKELAERNLVEKEAALTAEKAAKEAAIASEQAAKDAATRAAAEQAAKDAATRAAAEQAAKDAAEQAAALAAEQAAKDAATRAAANQAAALAAEQAAALAAEKAEKDAAKIAAFAAEKDAAEHALAAVKTELASVREQLAALKLNTNVALEPIQIPIVAAATSAIVSSGAFPEVALKHSDSDIIKLILFLAESRIKIKGLEKEDLDIKRQLSECNETLSKKLDVPSSSTKSNIVTNSVTSISKSNSVTQTPVTSVEQKDVIPTLSQLSSLSENITIINNLIQAYKEGTTDKTNLKKALKYYQDKYTNNETIMGLINRLLIN